MSKKTKTSSQSTSTATRTPTNPEWVTSGLQGLGGKIMGLADQDPRSFVAGPSTLQNQVFGDAAKLKTSPRFNQAGDIFNQVAGAGRTPTRRRGMTPSGTTRRPFWRASTSI